jgi:hypothetical protein
VELIEWSLAERFHWTLDYIRENISYQDWLNLNQIDDARGKARNSKMIKK